MSSCSDAVGVQQDLITRLVYKNVTVDSYSAILRTLATMVIQYVKDPPDQAVDSLWNAMRTWNKFGSQVTGNSTAEQRLEVAYASWAALSAQWQVPRGKISDRVLALRSEPHVDGLYLSFASEQFTGAMYRFGDNRRGPFGLLGTHRHYPLPDAFSLDMASGTDTLHSWLLNEDGDRVGPMENHTPYVPTTRPFYEVQKHIRDDAAARPLGAGAVPVARAWSEVYQFADGQVGMSWTAPVAYCGNYSCFEGVVSADITLNHVSADLVVRWERLRKMLSHEYNFHISADNSSIFIVNHVSGHHVWQQGLLVGTSHNSLSMPGGNLTMAVDSSQEVVRTTAMAIKDHFSSWTAEELQHGMQDFTYRPSAMWREIPTFVPCEPTDVSINIDADCRRVATLPVALDQNMKWLVVVVLPVGAFTDRARERSLVVQDTVQKIRVTSEDNLKRARGFGLMIFLGMAVLSMSFGFGLGYLVSRPLLKLSKLMRRLGELDFAHESQEWAELRKGRRSRVRDVGRLQNTFWSLSRGIEAFARFVPETVVRNIVRGDPRSTRLHVSRREVTIMFSDIRDFTSISETLSQRDLLFVLTRYLSVMTHIVEIFDGVVAEVLGDGLLAFWNTPDDVEDHAAKACAAALAMQQALVLLNAELAKLNLSKLAIRIGIHTGPVLSGNIGSEAKMKFGCLGDPVNTASRLEGLCKFYGVGVICSAATHRQLPGSAGFFARRLDLVQVKGKTEPMTIFEVIGRDCDTTQAPCSGSLAIGATAAASSAAAADVPGHEAQGPLASRSGRQGRRKGTFGSLWAKLAAVSPASWLARNRSRKRPRTTTGSSTKAESEGTSSADETLDAVENGDATGDATGRVSVRQSKDTITAEQRARAEMYEAALIAFQEARFAEACELATRLLEETPTDLAARSLLHRAQQHAGPDGSVAGLSEEELAAWTGVMCMGEK